VSVVVPAHAGGAVLAACLRSIAASSPPALEVIVACDGEPPGVGSLAAETGSRLLRSPRQRCAAAARNAGARAASGDVILFLDSDVAVPGDLVARVAAWFDEQPELAALIGSYDDDPAAPQLVSRYRNLLHHFIHQTARAEATTFWGGCGAVRRSVFLGTGGFDESYASASVEDIELGARLAAAGAVLRLDRTLQVKHLKRWTVGSFLWTDLVRRALPWARLMLRERRMPNDLNLRTRHRASAAVAVGVAAALVGCAYDSAALVAAGALLAAFVALNLGFLGFLWRRHGAALALVAVPLHLLHHLAGVAGFAVALASHLLRPLRARRA
jgi:GT2 family glycosyltransferase